ISEPFDCRGWEQPTCDREQVDRQLEEMHGLGVRSMLLLNKFDNPLAGVRIAVPRGRLRVAVAVRGGERVVRRVRVP
ncbi:MAG TPA: hypothetical protein VHF89_08340, partial [Solirubrobacteraceae bacterium]|nr:hypothetical protein [Solirubrobacteraceae bacterium]